MTSGTTITTNEITFLQERQLRADWRNKNERTVLRTIAIVSSRRNQKHFLDTLEQD